MCFFVVSTTCSQVPVLSLQGRHVEKSHSVCFASSFSFFKQLQIINLISKGVERERVLGSSLKKNEFVLQGCFFPLCVACFRHLFFLPAYIFVLASDRSALASIDRRKAIGSYIHMPKRNNFFLISFSLYLSSEHRLVSPFVMLFAECSSASERLIRLRLVSASSHPPNAAQTRRKSDKQPAKRTSSGFHIFFSL